MKAERKSCLLHEFLHGMGDEGVFIFAHVEAFGAVAPCARDDGQGAVAAGMPRDADLRIEDLQSGDLDGVAVLLLGLVLQIERGFELVEFRGGDGHRIIGGAVEFEAEGIREDGFDIVEHQILLVLAESFQLVFDDAEGALLEGELVDVFTETGVGETERQGAGLMVAGDDDKRFLRMLLGEFVGDFDGVVEGERLEDDGRRVVGVAVDVDGAAFAHHEEALRVVEQLNALLDEIRQEEAVMVVDVVGHVAGAFDAAGDDFVVGVVFAGKGAEVFARLDDFVAGLRGEFVDVALVGGGLLVVRLGDGAAGEIVIAGIDQIEADFIVFVAAGAMAVEGGGRGVVDGHGRDDTDLLAGLLRFVGAGIDLAGVVRGHADTAVVGLFTAGDGGSGRGGIRDERVGGTGSGRGVDGEMVDEQRFAFGLLQEGLRHGALRGGHTVADEQEHILRIISHQAEDE